MSIVSINFGFAGQVGINPRRIQMVVTDSLATITTANYLNTNGILPNSIYPTDIFDVIYNFSALTQTGTYTQLLPSIAASTGIITLSQAVSGGNVLLPVIANHMAAFNGTTGQIKSDATTIINSGNVQAGLSGTAGYLSSFPSAASKGSLRLTGVANTGDTLVTISNALHGQASVYSIPDSGSATATFAVCAAALVNGNVVKASGTAGKLVDAGYSLKAATTAVWGGGGAVNAFTATGVTATSIVTAAILTSTNVVSLATVVPTANTLTITFSGDPGANTTVSWIAISAAV